MPRQFAVLIMISCLPLTAGAAEPSPLVSPTADVMLALKVTAALQANSSLKDLPLTVDVVRGVAVVGGEVPDEAAVAAVRAAVGAVPSLIDAKVTCWVPGGNDPFLSRVREKLDGKPTPKPEGPAPPRVVLPPVADRRVETHVTAHRPAATGDAESAAEALRAGDPRFARLTLSFDAGLVVVGGRAASHADATALLMHLRKVPGVTRVRRGSIDAAD